MIFRQGLDAGTFDGVSFDADVTDGVVEKVVAECAADGGIVVVRGRFLNSVANKSKARGWDLSLSGVDHRRAEYAVRQVGNGASASGQASR